ncbi:hypothetical protein [Hydromonas duriensis]|uniref:DUF2946 family protein n=1 Tax=Hydromonas duriensis TaxID=1527608 RepID=A0A4R6Y7G0_9BURK|nr:hypothetical protein [Hydromonas duriensis]TDR31275.1 hypothetical protein DFR44_11138 [Hydromonas duriensis]
MNILRLPSSRRFLGAWLLPLLLWAALWPAHFANVAGRVVDVCTEDGVRSVWVQDDAGATATAISSKTADPQKSAHGQPHCAWCLFTLPALIFFAWLWCARPRSTSNLTTLYQSPLRSLLFFERWSRPRGPPVATPICL